MKIAILGGSFNPPHIGHALVARQVLENTDNKEVWLMPCSEHAFGKDLVHPIHRLKMVKVMESTNIKSSNDEIEIGGVSITFKTLTYLSQKYKQNEFTLIIGSDQIADLGKWDNINDIINNFGLIVFPRHNSNDKSQTSYKKRLLDNLNIKQFPSNIVIVENKNLVQSNISSTEIRRRIKNGLSINYLVSEKVKKYIIQKGLYK